MLRTPYVILIFLSAVFVLAANAGAGELRSFDPLEGADKITDQRASNPKNDTREAFIRKFEADVSKMKKDDIKALKIKLEKKYKDAKRDGDEDNSIFLSRLLGIIALYL